MAQEYVEGYCNQCNAKRKVERKSTNHILHFIITVILGIFTIGIGSAVWIVIWILSSIKIGGWICSTCGSSDVKAKGSMTIMQILLMLFAIGIVFSISRPFSKMKQNLSDVKPAVGTVKKVTADDDSYSDDDIQQIKEELVTDAQSDEMELISTASWYGNTFTLRANTDDNMYGYADYICENVLNSGRYDAAFANSQLIHIVIKDKHRIATLDTSECMKLE